MTFARFIGLRLIGVGASLMLADPWRELLGAVRAGKVAHLGAKALHDLNHYARILALHNRQRLAQEEAADAIKAEQYTTGLAGRLKNGGKGTKTVIAPELLRGGE